MADYSKIKTEPEKTDIEVQYDRAKQERFTIQKVQRVLEKTVGELADFVPFAWRNPIDISGHKKVGKVLKNIVTAETARRELVPGKIIED